MSDRLEQDRRRAEKEAEVADDEEPIVAESESSANPWYGFTDGEGPERL